MATKHRRSRRARGSYRLAAVGTILLMSGGLIFGTGAAATAHERNGFSLFGLLHLGNLGNFGHFGDDGGIVLINFPSDDGDCIDHSPPPYVGDGDGDEDDQVAQPCPTPTPQPTDDDGDHDGDHGGHHHHHHHHHHGDD